MRTNQNHADSPVRIFVVESERRVADAIFNPNGYPARLHDSVLSCGRRLALFLHDYGLCREAVVRDRALLVARILDPRIGIDALSRDVLRAGVVAVMDALTYSRALHGLLYALKSLLDVYAGTMVRAIGRGTGVMTFKRAKVDGTEIAGGRLINWLRRSAPKDWLGAESLAVVFESHSRSWITSAVGLRDQLTHYDDSSAVIDLHAKLHDEAPFLAEADVVGPSLKVSGESLDQFVARVHSGTLRLLSESIPFIPGVDVQRIRLDDLEYDPSHVVLRIETAGK